MLLSGNTARCLQYIVFTANMRRFSYLVIMFLCIQICKEAIIDEDSCLRVSTPAQVLDALNDFRSRIRHQARLHHAKAVMEECDRYLLNPKSPGHLRTWDIYPFLCTLLHFNGTKPKSGQTMISCKISPLCWFDRQNSNSICSCLYSHKKRDDIKALVHQLYYLSCLWQTHLLMGSYSTNYL